MTSPTTARRRPAGRYDPPSRLTGRLLAIVLTVLFLALLAAIATAFYSRLGGDQVRAQVVRYEVLSDSRVRIELEVTKPAGSPAYCIIRSRGRDGAEVGREVATVDAEGTPATVLDSVHELSTRGRAVTGEVGRCSASPIPAPSRAP